jgi:hypothetical protein
MANTEEDRVTSREEEYKEIIKTIEESPGIADLMKIYDEYQKIIKSSNRYLQEFQPKFTFSTSNSSE